MARVRFVEVAVAAMVVGGLTACGSSASGGAAGQGGGTSAGSVAASATSATSATSAASAGDSAASSAPSAGSGAGGHVSGAPGKTINAVLAGFSAGAITVDHMPTADPAWVARVQTEGSKEGGGDKVTDPKLLNLMALVDEAAREKSLTALKRLCSGDCLPEKQVALWQKPGALETLSTLIEKTHRTEGELLPGFVLVGGDSFGDADSAADGKVLGASSPKDYVSVHGGLATSFASGTGGQNPAPEHWTGLKVWGPYPS